MDLKTLNRIDTLRRRRSKGPETPKWLKPYHLLLCVFIFIATTGVLIRFF
ncbi:hypothetical protein [uncultured Chryseobacterium sp.]|nr:hypothetical protein [uncultured Chryseobacterium sp.]